MVHFYVGNTLSRLTERILDEVPQDSREKCVILVPDRYTLAVESTVAARLGATIHVEVLTFARLAERVLGASAANCLSPEGCTMLLSKALYRVKDSLTFYRRAAEVAGFANEMYSSLVALRESGVSVEDLRHAAEGMRGRTKDKTLDIAAIYSAYLAELATLLDPTTRLQRLIGAIPTSADVAECHFFVIDFYCFDHVQYEVLRALMIAARSVHVGYIGEDVGRDNRRIYPADMRGKLQRIAQQEGLFVDTTLVYEPLSPTKQILQDALFGYNEASVINGLVGAEERSSIRLFRAQDPTAELREVCAEIGDLLRNHGYRYRDIAIVCAEGGVYDDAMRAVFAEYGIPLFRDTKVLLSTEPVVRFLMDLLEAKRQNYGFDYVMKVVKNAFFACDQADVAYFENYCRKFGIAYTRFLQPFTLSSEGDDLARAEKVRQAFVEALVDVDECHTIGDYVDALLAFMRRYDVDARFAAFYSRQLQLGFAEGAKRSEQVPTRLARLLALTKRLLGDEPADLDKFVSLMRSSLDSVRISLLPRSTDCVYIGEAKDSRYDRVRAMFVVGAADGVLPETPRAGSILSDAFHNALQQQDIVVYPSAKDQGRYAMFYLEQLLLLPRDRLYVSYCARRVDGDNLPSVLVTSLSSMFGVPVTDGLGHPLSMQVGNRANAYKVLLRARDAMPTADVRALYTALASDDRSRYDALFATVDAPLPTPNDLFFGKEYTSISQLESYFVCPYMHFVRYGLRAVEREDSTLDVRETGTLLHNVLETFFARNYMRVDVITPDEVRAEVDECLRTALADARYEGLSASEKKVQLERVARESHIVVAREVQLAQRSLFKPAEFEVAFGEKGKYPPIDLGNGVTLKGKIDRIDRCDDKVLVIDYKSGSIDIDLSAVYFGTKVQIYAYLGALQKAGFVPAGAFYKHISGAYAKSGKGVPAGALRGHPPLAEDVLFAIDPALQTSASGEIVTVTMGKNGWKNYDDNGTMLTESQLQGIIDYVLDLMRQAVAEIREGYAEAKPKDSRACTYCKARYMCPNVGYEVRRKGVVTKESFEVSDDEQ